MTSFEKGLKQVQGSIETASAAAQKHQSKFESFTASVERSAKVFASIWVLWETAKDALSWLGDLEKFNVDIAHMTDLLQGNATAASTWMQVASLMGLDVTQVERAFVALSKQMDAASSPALKQMGLSAEDASGHLKSLNEMVLEAADYFHAHEGASNNAALAQELFGRSGAELLPILEKGRVGLDAITQMAQKYGLVLSADTIQRNLQFTEQLKESELALHGLGITLGNAALPGLALFGEGLNNLISQNLPAFEAAISRAVGYVLGFLEAITGMSFTIDDSAKLLGTLSTATGDLGTQQDSAASSAQALADAEQRVRDQATAATAAIDAQIHALQSSQDFQKFTDQQTALKQKATDEQAAYDLAKFLNNNVQAEQLALQLAATQQQISRGQSDEDTKLKISSLEAQKKGIQDAANDQIKQMQRAARGGSDAFGAMSSGLTPQLAAGAKNAGDAFQNIMGSAAAQTGLDMGSKLMDALFGPLVFEEGRWERIGGNTDFVKIGEVIGESIGTGIAVGVGTAFGGWWNNVVNNWAAQFQDWLIATLKGDNNSTGRPPQFAYFDEGGTVPGAPGAPMFAVVHGAEVVRTPQQESQLQRRLSAFSGAGAPAAFTLLASGSAADSGAAAGSSDVGRLVVGQDRAALLLGQAVAALQAAVQLLQSIESEGRGSVSGGQLASWASGR